ncbi:MAG: electron transport complex protein RnfA [Brevinema sp.]
MAESSYLIIFITAVFSGNMVFSKFLGLCPFFGVTKNMNDAIGMGITVVGVQMLTVLITWPLYHLVLVPLGLEVLQTMLFILVIASCVQILEAIMKKVSPTLYKALGIYLPLITTNCIILGIALIVIAEGLDYGRAIWYAFCASLGFLLALIMMAGMLEKVKNAPVPKAVQGAPLAFFIATIISIAFIGFSGFSIN